VDLVLAGRLERRLGARGVEDAVSLVLEHLAQHPAQRIVVVDHQELARGHGISCCAQSIRRARLPRRLRRSSRQLRHCATELGRAGAGDPLKRGLRGQPGSWNAPPAASTAAARQGSRMSLPDRTPATPVDTLDAETTAAIVDAASMLIVV